MSKAFTRESDDVPEMPLMRKIVSTLPPGVKNYFTAQGLQILRDQLTALEALPPTPATRQQVFQIQQSLQTAVVVEPPPPPWEQVLFGAAVTVRNQRDEEFTYRIVGVDEADAERDHISWLSPVAKALLKARIGDRVRFRTPAGEQELEILKVDY